MTRIVALALILCVPTGALALCVENGSDRVLLFTVEARPEGTRLARELAPGASLCLADTAGGVIGVYQTAQSLEGCARLIGPGGSDRLLEHHDFDRCLWASHLTD